MRIYLCDDNEQELEFYTEQIQMTAAKHNQPLDLSSFKNGEELLFQLEDEWESVDAIYLDIYIPSLDGITIAEKLRTSKFKGEVIFLTRSKKHFLPAFDVGAFNYIIKNETTQERFEMIFLRIAELCAAKEEEYMLVRGGGELRKITINSINYFEIQNRIVTVHYQDAQFQFISTMERIQNQLYKKPFIRIHRAILVALRAIETISYDTLKLKNGETLPIGRTYQKPVQDYLKSR